MRITLALVFLSVLATSTEAGKKKCHRKGREIPLDIPADQYAIKPTGPADTHYKLKTGPNGEYMGGSRGAAQVPFNEMHTVPVTRKTYEPRTTVKAAYVAEVPAERNPIGNKPAVMVAECQFQTKNPTINLDNFAQVKKIACSDEQVTVTFDSDASAAKAAEEWGKAKDLSFIVGREWKCNGGKDETAMRLVKNVAKGTDAKTLIFNAKPGSRNDVIESFDITVNQYNGGELPAPGSGNKSSLDKRSIFKWDKGGSKTWDLGVNYDKASQSARNPQITLLNTPWVGAKCIECYAYGEATLSVRVTGTLFIVKTYSVQLSGEVKANMDLLVTAYKTARTDLISANLFVLPLNPVSIPGVLSLGPELRLKAGISYDLAEDIELTTGFNFKFPFSWSVRSNNGLFGRPEASAEGTPVFTPRVPQLSKDFQVSVAGHLIPEFALSMSILKIPAFDLFLNLDNALGVQLSRGTFSTCPDQSMNLMVFHEHALNFGVKSIAFSKNWPLWQSGRRPLPCPNNACNRCIGSKKTTALLTSTSTSLTATATSTSATLSSATATSTTASASTTAAASASTTTSTALTSVQSTSTASTQTSTSSVASLTEATTTSTVVSTQTQTTSSSSAAVTTVSTTATTSTAAMTQSSTTQATPRPTTSATAEPEPKYGKRPSTSSVASTTVATTTTTTTTTSAATSATATPTPAEYAYGRRRVKGE